MTVRGVGKADRGDQAGSLERLEQAPANGPHAVVRLLARVVGIGIETVDMLVQEVLSRNLWDRKAVWPATPASQDRPMRGGTLVGARQREREQFGRISH